MKVGTESVLYTGDYNMTPDRHLGAAWVDKCRPSLLITESTYATTIRDSKRYKRKVVLFIIQFRGAPSKFQSGGGVLKKNVDPALRSRSRKFMKGGDEILN